MRGYRRVPAESCAVCGCPDRTHDYDRGPVCAACGATWPVYAVEREGPR